MFKTTIENYSLPVQDYELSEMNFDDRFTKVKIFVAHTGENLNNTSFSLESLLRLKETIANIPIVGYVGKNEFDDDDFRGHEERIVIDPEKGIEIDYLGIPFGLIPEDNNAKIEFREAKEWLTVEGYLWNKFPKAIEIFKRSNNRKGQSMEITKVDGYMSDTGVFNIENAVFDSLCILGNDIAPAMIGSTIEVFSEGGSSLKGIMKEMMLEFSKKGEEEDLTKEELERLNAQQEESSENPETTDEKVEEGKDEELNVVVDDENKTVAIKEGKDEEEEDEAKADEEPAKADEAQTVPDGLPEADPTGGSVTIGTDPSLNTEFEKENEDLRSKVSELESELAELREFKANREKADKLEVLGKHSDELTSSEMEEFTANIDKYSIDELEKEIVFTSYKREASATSTSAKSYSQNYKGSENKNEFGAYDAYFK